MRYQILFLFIILSFLISCGGSPVPNNNTNTRDTNVANKPSSNSPLNTNTKPTLPTTNAAPTISPVVQGYLEALKKKDEAGAKKYLSAAALKYYESEAKGEKKTWFTFVLEENDPVDEKREVRNEKIEGAKAVAEIKGGNYGGWIKVAFVKENGEWKFDSPEVSPEIKDIPKTETLSNKPQ